MRIYLDVCCFNRPFDDHTQDRVRLESEAILTILNHCETKNWILIGSEVIDIEIFKIPDDNRRQRVEILSAMKEKYINIGEDTEVRAIELEKLSFKSFDSLHIACAEKGKADVLLTTDDNLLQKSLQNKDILKVKVENPVSWLMEVIKK